MPKTFELTIRDGKKVLHTASANVGDDFERDLFDAYLTYYPDAQNDGQLFYRIVRGLFEGVMNNIVAASRMQQPELPVPQFTIEGEEVVESVEEPEPVEEEEANAV